MSRKQSGYLQQIRAERIAAQEASRKTFEQYLADTAVIALNRKGWGEKRIREFLAEWGKVHDEYYDALRTTPETDYYRQKLDEAIKPLCKAEPFVPFEERYEYLPEMRY